MNDTDAKQCYQAGISYFERGRYREAIAELEKAKLLSNAATRQGGEIQVWLANAYDAVGRSSEAMSLCRSLVKHPDRDVRKSARYVLRILSAPQLRKLTGVNSEISSGGIFDTYRSSFTGKAKSGSKQPQAPPELGELPPQSGNEIEIGRFIWISAAIAGLLLLLWAVA